MDEEFEEEGWMSRHRSGEDEVCCSQFLSVFHDILTTSTSNVLKKLD